MTKGIDILIKVDNEVIALQKGAKLNRSADTIENTTKSSAGWKEYEASFKSWSVDCNGLYTLPTASGNASFRTLEDAFLNGDHLTVEFVLADDTELATGDTSGYTGEVIITDFPLDAPQDDSVTFSVSLLGTGALSEINVA